MLMQESGNYIAKQLSKFLIVTLLQDNIFFEQSLVLVFFSSIRGKVLLVEDMTNPKRTTACFEMIIDFSGCKINSWLWVSRQWPWHCQGMTCRYLLADISQPHKPQIYVPCFADMILRKFQCWSIIIRYAAELIIDTVH